MCVCVLKLYFCVFFQVNVHCMLVIYVIKSNNNKIEEIFVFLFVNWSLTIKLSLNVGRYSNGTSVIFVFSLRLALCSGTTTNYTGTNIDL